MPGAHAFREYNFDGIVGPTHHYGGLSAGNLASTDSRGHIGNPRAAALEGLEKMRFVASLGVGQAVLPPQPRPPPAALTRLGYAGNLNQALEQAYLDSPGHVSRLLSASAMWTANAASVAPSSDTEDGCVHLLVANLSAMAHRSLEAVPTHRVLSRIFSAPEHFRVHEPLPAYLGDEGAANQLRLASDLGRVHVLAWGRRFEAADAPRRFVARQSREASRAAQRLCRLAPRDVLLWQQDPAGIDVGAFHSDVLAVSNENVLLLHEAAFLDCPALLEALKRKLGDQFRYCLAKEEELPVHEAVRSYPFNSQLVTLPQGKMVVIAPLEAQASTVARAFLERTVSELPVISGVYYVSVNGSMRNGGGPACLRLRVSLSDAERSAIRARVFFDDALYAELKHWILQHYRSELTSDDLRDHHLIEESYRALDELTQILELGSIYDFQRDAGRSEP